VLIGTGALPGYSWHALARIWRTPGLGELFMATTTRTGFRALLRRGQPRPLPRAFVDRTYDDFDRTTRRAVLELYRSVADVGTTGTRLAQALAPLDRPALVLWGARDPYLPVTYAERQRQAFPHAEIRVLEHAGHWPFVDEPATVSDAITDFLARHQAELGNPG
jgi:pimeloyl-ACP methyl ester carboxylesterase